MRRVKRSAVPGPYPFDPQSPGYQDRSAVYVTDLGASMVRVDVGAPIPRLPSETQAIRQDRPEVAPPAPAAPPQSARPAAPPSEAAEDRRRNHRAITREP